MNNLVAQFSFPSRYYSQQHTVFGREKFILHFTMPQIAQLKATKVSIGVAPTPNPKAAPPPPPDQHSLQQRAPRDQPPSSSDDLRLSVQKAKPSPKASSTSYSKGKHVKLPAGGVH